MTRILGTALLFFCSVACACDAVLLDTKNEELARTRFSVMARDAQPSISVAKAIYRPGEPIGIAWTNAPGFRFDWVGIYRRNESNVYNYLGFVTTGARHEGELRIDGQSLPEPLSLGDYELRLMHDDSYVTLAVTPFAIELPVNR